MTQPFNSVIFRLSNFFYSSMKSNISGNGSSSEKYKHSIYVVIYNFSKAILAKYKTTVASLPPLKHILI